MDTYVKRGAKVALVTALCAIWGSFTVFAQLRPETEIPGLRGAGQMADELSSNVRWYEVASPGGTPVKMAVEEKGTGVRDHVIVMIPGVLSDRRAWRYVAGVLGQYHDLLLVDLPGSGDSDKRDPKIVGDKFYSPESLAQATLEALRQNLQGRGATRITLMAHSLGGRVALSMLGDPSLRRQYEGVLARVDRAVLLAGLDVHVVRRYEEFLEIVNLSDSAADVGKATGILKMKCEIATYFGSQDPSRTPRESAERLIEILSDPSTRHAQQAMLRQAVTFHPNGQPDFDRIAELEENYKNVEVPCLILWGARDQNLSVNMGYKLAVQLPQACLRILPSCTHALASERPVLVAELVRRFVVADRSELDKRILHIDDALPEKRTVEALSEHWDSVLPQLPPELVRRAGPSLHVTSSTQSLLGEVRNKIGALARRVLRSRDASNSIHSVSADQNVDESDNQSRDTRVRDVALWYLCTNLVPTQSPRVITWFPR